jgi:hypothetical protein
VAHPSFLPKGPSAAPPIGVCVFYFMESATIIFFFGERGVVKKSTLCTLVIMMKKMDGPLSTSMLQTF